MKGIGNIYVSQDTDAHTVATDNMKSRAYQLFEKTDEAIMLNNLTYHRSFPDTDLILYYSALYEATMSEEYGCKVDALLADAFAAVNENNIRRFNAGLTKGLSTLLYLADMQEKRGRYVDYGVKRDLIEDYCFQYARRLIAIDANGFLTGSFGILFTFLNTSFYSRKQKQIEILLEDIDAAAVQNLHRFWIRSCSGDNRHDIDFSMSSGQSAYLLILLQALERGISIDRNYMSITKGINYLLQVKQDVDNESKKYSFFPESVNSLTHQRTYSNRLSWNGGDLSEAVLLYNAADTLSNKIYLQVADIVGTSSLMRVKQEETLCADGSFYYGSSGVAQLYKTLHKLRPLPAYEKGYHFWMERTMDFLEEELQRGIYHSRERDLLNGLVGVSLTLLSFINEKELSWSRLCLL